MSFKEKDHQISTVGLTGGIGGGKSTVGRVFETLGIPCFNADKYAHHIYKKDKIVRNQVVEAVRPNIHSGKMAPVNDVAVDCHAATILYVNSSEIAAIHRHM